jgi:hypothetical protein
MIEKRTKIQLTNQVVNARLKMIGWKEPSSRFLVSTRGLTIWNFKVCMLCIFYLFMYETMCFYVLLGGLLCFRVCFLWCYVSTMWLLCVGCLCTVFSHLVMSLFLLCVCVVFLCHRYYVLHVCYVFNIQSIT